MEKSLSKIRDVDLKILEELNDKDLFNFCLTSKYGKSLCDNEDFWRRRFIQRFGKLEKSETRTWKDFYLKLVYHLNKYDYRESVEELSRGGWRNIDLIKYFISQGVKNFNDSMGEAAKIGDRKLVDFFISKGAYNFNWGMERAALGGHKDLVDLFVSQGADKWNLGMRAAAEGGHKDLVNFFISQGADNWNCGMYGAAEGGHKDLVNFFISQGANNWNMGIAHANIGGHADLVDFLVNKRKEENI